MTARIIILADYRAQRACIEIDCHPMAAWAAWVNFWLEMSGFKGPSAT